jgi:hypothetical protein
MQQCHRDRASQSMLSTHTGTHRCARMWCFTLCAFTCMCRTIIGLSQAHTHYKGPWVTSTDAVQQDAHRTVCWPCCLLGVEMRSHTHPCTTHTAETQDSTHAPCEMMGPPDISSCDTRALQTAQSDKSGKGARVAALQHTRLVVIIASFGLVVGARACACFQPDLFCPRCSKLTR